jgi:dienelactone hydrolase
MAVPCFLVLTISTLLTCARGGAGGPGDTPETGFRLEVAVKKPTRLDWQFAVSDFGQDAARLPVDYESSRQRYQLYIPPAYDAAKTWPLVVFISPGDDPLGWRYWRKTCAEGGLFFCAAYGAGNNCPPGRRARIVLDMLDDVRRSYRIDPDQTYLTGFSGGGRLACTLAFALPDHFGGVLPVCGANPLNRLDYLRHRVQDRLSVAFATGSDDFNRKEYEEYLSPYFSALGIRSQLWIVPQTGHAMPPDRVLAEAVAWLAEDRERRRQEVQARPALAASPDDVPGRVEQANKLLETARAELLQPDRIYRGVVMLRGVVVRYARLGAEEEALKLLNEVRNDPQRLRRLNEQGGAEERRLLTAQARALERFGEPAGALKAWAMLARAHADTPEGEKASAAVQRLTAVLMHTPYLGLHLAGDGNKVQAVIARGPADKAGVRAGDRLLQIGTTTIGSLADLRRALQTQKPGDRLTVEVERASKRLTLHAEVGSFPLPESTP